MGSYAIQVMGVDAVTKSTQGEPLQVYEIESEIIRGKIQ